MEGWGSTCPLKQHLRANTGPRGPLWMHLQTDFRRPGRNSSYQEQQNQPDILKSFFNEAAEENWQGNSLNILGPFWGITECHESTVGQDGEHDQHAEHRGNVSQGRKYLLTD